MKKKILAIDGGGVLGIGPLAFLVEMERAGLGAFHALAGTSTGSILIALYLAKGSWTEAFRVFNANFPDIFHQPWNYRLDPLPRELEPHPKYDGAALRSLLFKHLGDVKCSDFPMVPFFIPAFNWRTGKFKVWGNKDGDLLREVVQASTAAPGYFPPSKVPAVDPALWADGGLAANNPAMVALCGCLRGQGWNLADLNVLSLGTGGNYWKDPKITENSTLIGMAGAIVDSMFAGSLEMVNYQAQAILTERFLRISPTLAHGLALDSVGDAPGYADLWRGLWTTEQERVSQWWSKSND